MNRCKTCKWWNDPLPEYEIVLSWELQKTHRPCLCNKINGNQCEDLDGLLADAEGNYSTYVGPEFGCLHWEVKGD